MEKFAFNGKKIACAILRIVASIILIATTIIVTTSITPIYNFKEVRPFGGPDIYNPYKSLDRATSWKRANFHTHTRVEGFANECKYWANEVLERYKNLGYDIVTFSNHNQLTRHPQSDKLQVDVYEHGYNLFKFHKLAFGAKRVWHFDHLLPIFASQKQFQIVQLSKDADVVQLNHPLRTPTLSESQLERISGYRLIELDSGKSTDNRYWDSALSAGRYSFGVANDDLHHPDKSYKIARRCNFLSTPSGQYDDILRTLNEGCFYSMRLPDYGKGDWEIKFAKNRALPFITDIGARDSVVYITLSQPATLIKMIGQNHTILAQYNNCDSASYTMKESDPYVRVITHFPDGEVIYTNPFARYDASLEQSPFDNALPQINILLTILYNLTLLAIFLTNGYLFYKYIIKR